MKGGVEEVGIDAAMRWSLTAGLKGTGVGGTVVLARRLFFRWQKAGFLEHGMEGFQCCTGMFFQCSGSRGEGGWEG